MVLFLFLFLFFGLFLKIFIMIQEISETTAIENFMSEAKKI
jgi:hypothetical protein